MTLVHEIFDEQFEFSENKPNILIIENKKFFQQSVLEFIMLENGKECKYTFFENLDEIKKDINIVTDIFNLEVNSTKNLTKLYNSIKNNYVLGEKYTKYMELSQSVNHFLCDVMQSLDYAVDFNEQMDLTAFFKLNNLKFIFNSKDIIEQMMDYMDILVEFIGMKIFVFVNVHNVISNNEAKELYKFLELRKYTVLFLESSENQYLKKYQNIRIIDDDLCVII